MKKIELKTLRMQNFKGAKDRAVEFGRVTDIYGANAAGKTTIADAFQWIMFGTDSTGAAKFNVRPLDASGKTVDGVDICVECVLVVDGEEIALKKTQRQNWVKKRGTGESKLQGNVNEYEIDGYPASEKEFKEKTEGIISRELFKMLSDPRTFASMDWKKQREVIMRFVSDVTDADVMAADPEKYAAVAEDVRKAGTEKCLEKATRAAAKLKEKQKELPVRIDQAGKALVDVPDVAELAAKQEELKAQLEEVQKQRDGADGQFKAADAVMDEIMGVKMEISGVEQAAWDKVNKALRDAEAAYDELNGKADKLFAAKADKEKELKALKESLLPGVTKRLKAVQDEYREAAAIKWDTDLSAVQFQPDEFIRKLRKCQEGYREEEKKVFGETNTRCPLCGREYPPEKVGEMREAFESARADEMEFWQNRAKAAIKEHVGAVMADGNEAGSAVKAARERISRTEAELAGVREQWTAATGEASRAYEFKNGLPKEPDLEQCEGRAALVGKLRELQKQLEGMSSSEALKQQLTIKERGIREELDAVNGQFAAVELNKKTQAQVDELKRELRDTSQKVADQEKVVYLLEELSQAKMGMLAERINAQFELVNVKLFERQINGGMKPTCEITVDGVPYSDLNSAGRMQAGLDVIRALQRLYQVSAPVFLDNRESVSVIPAADAQVINLYVSEADKELRVEREE